MGLGLAVTLMLFTAATAQQPKAYYLGDQGPGNLEDNQAGHPDWMSLLPDDLPLTDLSIPGTHDSMADCLLIHPDTPGDYEPRCDGHWPSSACILPEVTTTQRMFLKAQLESGIRFLDIRVRHSFDRFLIYHGAQFLGWGFFDGVLKVVDEFLDSHPGETILMRVQPEQGPHNGPTDNQEPDGPYDWVRPDSQVARRSPARHFANAFYAYVNKLPADRVYQGSLTHGRCTMPTLGDVRGKIVFLPAFNDWLRVANCLPESCVGEMPNRSCTSVNSEDWCFGSGSVTNLVKCQGGFRYNGSGSPFVAFREQNKWNDVTRSEKWQQYVLRHFVDTDLAFRGLNGLNPNVIAVNFTSANTVDSGDGLICDALGLPGDCSPVDFAKSVNPKALQWLFYLTREELPIIRQLYGLPGDWEGQEQTGIVPMDFPGAGLIDAIIARNFRNLELDRLSNSQWQALQNNIQTMYHNVAYSAVDDLNDGDPNNHARDIADSLLGFMAHNFPQFEWQNWVFRPNAGYHIEHERLWTDTDPIYLPGHPTQTFRRILREVSDGGNDVDPSLFYKIFDITIPQLTGDAQTRADALAAAFKTNFPFSHNLWNVLVLPSSAVIGVDVAAGATRLVGIDTGNPRVVGNYAYYAWTYTPLNGKRANEEASPPRYSSMGQQSGVRQELEDFSTPLVGKQESQRQQDLAGSGSICPCNSYGDFDSNGRIDLRDVANLLNCFTGRDDGPAAPDCECVDSDADGDIDLGDFSSLIYVYSR